MILSQITHFTTTYSYITVMQYTIYLFFILNTIRKLNWKFSFFSFSYLFNVNLLSIIYIAFSTIWD